MLLKIGQKSAAFKGRKSRWRGVAWSLPLVFMGTWVGYRWIESQLIKPEAVFVLGGHEEREWLAAKLAKQHPNLPIWVSGGSPQHYAEKIFAKEGINGDRLHLDYQAVDTVTNFTTLVDELQAQGIESVYLVTSDYHMRRARIIGEIIFGSRGILLKPLPVSTGKDPEPIEKSVRDGARAILWLTTGSTGEELIEFSGISESAKLKP